MEKYRIIGIVAMAATVTFLLRSLPFLIFGKNQQMPKDRAYLGKVLPPAMMAILIVYCMRSISIRSAGSSLAMILAAMLTAVSYKWKHNTFLSIAGGTACYMFLCHI